MRYVELGIVAVVLAGGALLTYKFLGPSNGWCGPGMKDILTSSVSIGGTFLAALLAMVLYVSQSLRNRPFVNVQARGRLPEFVFSFALAAFLWCLFLICSLALQTYTFPQEGIRQSARIWHAFWAGAGMSAVLLTGYLFIVLLRAASEGAETPKATVRVPFVNKTAT